MFWLSVFLDVLCLVVELLAQLLFRRGSQKPLDRYRNRVELLKAKQRNTTPAYNM